MCDSATRQLIEDEVKNKVSNGEMFTAYDVTCSIRKNGTNETHNEIKEVVHDLFNQGDMVNYDRTRFTIPGKGSWAWLYFPIGTDYNDYARRFTSTSSSSTTTVSSVSSTPGFTAAVSGVSPVIAPDSEGRVNIPKQLLRDLGLYSQRSYCIVNGKNKVIVTTAKFARGVDPKDVLERWVPFNGAIRISKKVLSECGVSIKDSYVVEKSFDEVTVK